MNGHSVWSLDLRPPATRRSSRGKEMGALARSLAVLAALGAVAADRSDRRLARSRRAGPRRRRGRRRLLARRRLGRPVRDRRQLRRSARRRPHHPLLPPQRLVRDPVAPQRPRAGRRGRRRHAASRSSRTTSTSPRTCSTAAPPSCSSRATPGITRANLTMAVTHDHSSPYYSSTSWGAWAFQDVYDVRFFDYYAKRMAEAVEQAADAPGAGAGRRLGQHVRQDPPPLVRPRGRRRRHAGRLSATARPTTT